MTRNVTLQREEVDPLYHMHAHTHGSKGRLNCLLCAVVLLTLARVYSIHTPRPTHH